MLNEFKTRKDYKRILNNPYIDNVTENKHKSVLDELVSQED